MCYWDELSNVQQMLEDGRLDRSVTVTVKYQDIIGDTYSHEWDIDPLLYQGLRTIGYRDMSDLVDIVERISEEGVGRNNRE